MSKLFQTFFLCVVVPGIVFSQTKPVHIEGFVHDTSSVPLSYANVFLAGTFTGDSADKSGYFSFAIPELEKYNLSCIFIGYDKHYEFIEVTDSAPPPVTIIMNEASLTSQAITVQASSFSIGDEQGVTLSSLDVVLTPGAAADVMMAIHTFPGVQKVDAGSGLFVRGDDVSETAVLLDGVYMFHPYRFTSPNGGFFGQVSPMLLKGTYFSSGGFGAEYGNALSGVLAMESSDMPLKKR